MKFNIDIGYEDENPLQNWFVRITIPKQQSWKQTEQLAEKVRKSIEKVLEENN